MSCFLENYEKMLEEYKEQVERTIKSISRRSFGNFLLTTTFLLQQLAVGYALKAFNDIIVNGIIKNVIGTVSAVVALAINLLATPRHILIYMGTRKFNRAVKKRRAITQELLTQSQSMLNFFTSLAKALEGPSEENFEDVERALQHVRSATNLVSSQANRTLNGEIIDTNSLERAVDEMEFAIDELTAGGFSIDDGILGNPSVPFSFDGPSIRNPINMFTEWIDAIYEEYFDPELSPEQRLKNMEAVKDLVFDKISEFPTGVRAILYVSVFSKQSQYFFELLPMPFITVPTVGIPEEVKDFFEVSFTEPEKKSFDYTFSSITNDIDLSKTFIKGFYVDYQLVEAEGGLFKNSLFPASRKLRSVRDEMQDALNANLNDRQISSKKTEWSISIMEANTLTTMSIQNKLSFGGVASAPIDDQRILAEGESLYNGLQAFIGSEESETLDRASDIIGIALRYMGLLIATPAVLVAPGIRENVIAGLQAVKILLSGQLNIDSQYISLSEKVLTKYNSSPYFRDVALPQFEALINSISDGPLVSGLVSQLEDGNIVALANALKGNSVKNLLEASSECLSIDIPDLRQEALDVFISQLGDTSDSIKDFKAEVDQSIAHLTDQKLQLTAFKKLAEVSND